MMIPQKPNFYLNSKKHQNFFKKTQYLRRHFIILHLIQTLQKNKFIKITLLHQIILVQMSAIRLKLSVV